MKSTQSRSVTITPWTKSEVTLLEKAIEKSGFNWFEIAKQLPNRSPNQCAQKWKRLNGERSRHQQFWTQSEDEKLKQLVNSLGNRWVEIAKRMKNRNRQQCRDRYILLDPNIKSTPYTEEEDQLIYENYLQLGPKWSMISKMLEGRSGNQVKNRFYSHIRKHYLKIENPYYMKEAAEEGKLMLQAVRKHHLDQFFNGSTREDSILPDSQEFYQFSNEIIGIYGHTNTNSHDDDF